MASLQSYSAIQRILSSPRKTAEAPTSSASPPTPPPSPDDREALIVAFHSSLWARACSERGVQRPLVLLRRAPGEGGGGAVVALWQDGVAMLSVMARLLGVDAERNEVERAVERSWDGCGVACEVEMGAPASTTIFWDSYDGMVEAMFLALPEGEKKSLSAAE